MEMADDKRAVILLSGGLDSATTLAIATDQGYRCVALSFDYGQRHRAELRAAQRVARDFAVSDHRIVALDLAQIGGSALTDEHIEVPVSPTDGIPVTYVPARNTLFLSYALAWAEVLAISDIFIGVNAVDYAGYPDCRSDYIRAFEKMANLATRSGVGGRLFKIHTPLIQLTKAEIIRQGARLNVDYAMTISCYQSDDNGVACGICDACRFRKQGFEDAGIVDPVCYRATISDRN